MKNNSKFDNAIFIEDIYQCQKAFVRRDDEQKVKELITYTIQRIKQALRVSPKEMSTYDFVFEFKQRNAPKQKSDVE